MVQVFEASAGDGKLAVAGILTITDGGCVLQIYGGTREHVGSVIVSVPRPSLIDKDRTSVTSSVINLPSHQEELVGRPASELLAVALGRPVVCVAGIHVDEATNDERELLTKYSEDIVRLLMQKLQEQKEG